MMRRLLFVTAILALGACSTAGNQKPPVCDGKHRRPANPYGSVLDPAVRPAATTAKPDKLSTNSQPFYRGCGA